MIWDKGGIYQGDNSAGHCFVLRDLIPMNFSTTLEFQIKREGGINREAGRFRPNNKQGGGGGCNEQGGWKKSPKLINGEVGINNEAGKSKSIRNFIEILLGVCSRKGLDQARNVLLL